MPGADMNVDSRFLDIISKNLESTLFVLASLDLVTPTPTPKRLLFVDQSGKQGQ